MLFFIDQPQREWALITDLSNKTCQTCAPALQATAARLQCMRGAPGRQLPAPAWPRVRVDQGAERAWCTQAVDSACMAGGLYSRQQAPARDGYGSKPGLVSTAAFCQGAVLVAARVAQDFCCGGRHEPWPRSMWVQTGRACTQWPAQRPWGMEMTHKAEHLRLALC